MKYAVLSLTLGYGKEKVLLKDIELWDENIITNIKDRPLIWSGRYVSYVSVQKLHYGYMTRNSQHHGIVILIAQKPAITLILN